MYMEAEALSKPDASSARRRVASPVVWGAVGAMFVAIHSPPDRVLSIPFVQKILGRLPEAVGAAGSFSHLIVAPLRTTLFVPSAALLVYVFAREVRTRVSLTRADVRNAAFLFAALSALMIPFHPPFGVKSMGLGYARMSVDPFAAESGWHYRRLLAPAIAHVTGLSGPVYIVLATALTFCLVLLVQYTTRRAFGSSNRFSLVAALSICTSSFVLFNFQSPGYPDPAYLIVALLLGMLELDTVGVMAAVALALATHEVVAFLLVPILVFRYSGAPRRAGLIVIALYSAVMGMSFRLDVNGVVHSQTIVDGKSSFAYLVENPWLAVAGVIASLKLLWLLVIGLIVSPRSSWRTRAEVSAYVVAALSTLPFVVDASRLAGMSVAGLMFHLGSYTRAESLESRATSVAFKVLMVANIVIPTVYVGLNVGFRTSPGLYSLMWRGLSALFR